MKAGKHMIRIGLVLILTLVLIYIIFIIISCVVPPLHQHKMHQMDGRFSLRRESMEKGFPTGKEKYVSIDETYHTDKGKNERIRCITSNHDALIWRLKLIELAKKEIILSTYDFTEEKSGLDVMSALYQAAKRGVRIKILIDGVNAQLHSTKSEPFQQLLSLPQVEAKIYNPVGLFNPWAVNYRMHDKYLMIDESVYVLGGRNTNDLFLGDYRKTYNFDMDVLVYQGENKETSSYQDLHAYFEKVWALKCCKNIELRKTNENTQQILDSHYASVIERYKEVRIPPDWGKETSQVESVELLSNPINPSNKVPLIWYRVKQLLLGGEDIIIQTPYIVCNKDMYQDLEVISYGGRRIQTIINAVESGTNPFGCTDYLNQKKKVQETGMEIYELMGTQAMHTKMFLIDDTISIIGSYNLDMRSTYLNTELMLVIKSEDTNRMLREESAKLMQESKRIDSNGVISYGMKYQKVTMTGKKKAYYWLLRIITYPVRHLL